MAKLLRIDDVTERTGMAKATVYRMINDGAFPAPVKPTGSRMSAWPEEVVDNWIRARTGANGGLQT